MNAAFLNHIRQLQNNCKKTIIPLSIEEYPKRYQTPSYSGLSIFYMNNRSWLYGLSEE